MPRGIMYSIDRIKALKQRKATVRMLTLISAGLLSVTGEDDAPSPLFQEIAHDPLVDGDVLELVQDSMLLISDILELAKKHLGDKQAFGQALVGLLLSNGIELAQDVAEVAD